VPIHEYKCGHCGYIYEIVRRTDDKPPQTCPRCGGFQLQGAQMSAPAIVKVN
jgi:putative FmdB family regulatory protein